MGPNVWEQAGAIAHRVSTGSDAGLIKVCCVQLLSRVHPLVTPWTAVHQASLYFTICQSLLKLMSIESMMPSNHLILCHLFILLPSIFPSMSLFQLVSSLHQVAKVLEHKHHTFQ